MEKTGRIACSLQSVSNAALCEGEEETRKAYTGNRIILNAIAHWNQKIDHLCIRPHSGPAGAFESVSCLSAGEGLLQAPAERAIHDRRSTTH